MKIITKFIVGNVIMVAIIIVSLTGISLCIVKNALVSNAVASQDARLRTFWDLLNQGREARIESNRLMIGNYVVNGDNLLPDRLKALCGGTAAIFMGDTRVATNVLNSDGSRALGTKLDGPAYDAVFRAGKPYRGETVILGTPYFAAYDPIKNSSGETIGALYVGVRTSDYLGAYDRLLILMSGLASLLLLAAALVTLFFMRHLFKPLNLLHDTLLSSEAEADLARRVSYDENNEIGEICRSFNALMTRFHDSVARLVHTSAQISERATMLSSAYEMMAGNAGDVAGQAGTIAVATEEMAATSNEVSGNCLVAAHNSEQANSSALTGASVIQGTVAVMGRIAERVQLSARTVGALGAKSDQIGEIVGTIEDIADQTNLLALNAAIEAARAGEQGRGFAVVADEVRALAERTTKATKEIATMIKAVQSETKGAVRSMEEGVSEVDRGTAEAAESGRVIQEILNQIQAVTIQVNQIATAAEEQTATSSEISNSIQLITAVMSASAEVATDSARSAAELAQLSDDLQKQVGQFRLAA